MDSSSDCNLNPAARLLREEIARHGPISFARFMQVALYHPEHGYYARNNIGKSGDFFTSVSVGPLFGQMLAFYLAQRLEKINGELKIVEAGANDGQLARDILDWLALRRPKLLERLTYCIIEPLPKLQDAQCEKLAGRPVEWLQHERELGRFRGAFISNELLDAFPMEVYRWRKAEGSWFLYGAGISGAQFEWVEVAPTTLLDLRAVESHLPDMFAYEKSPLAETFWAIVGQRLETGLMLAIDYGYETLNPANVKGTLRGYRDHKLVEDVLQDPGEVDITASVNFERIRGVGAMNGVKTERLVSQERFLTQIASEFFKVEKIEARQFQTLTHLEHLGRFKVLVQSRISS